MTTPANLTYTDIQTRVANELRIPTSNATEMTKIAAVINAVYRDIYAKQDWWWALKRTVINTTPQFVAGVTNVFGTVAPASVSVTANSAAISFSTSGPAISISLAGYSFLIPGAANDSLAVYRILSNIASSYTATLDAAFTDVTSTATSYNAFLDYLTLPTDCNKVIQVKRWGERLPIRPIGREAMASLKITDTTAQKPEVWTVDDFATTGDPTTARQLIVHPYPDKAYRLEILYKQQLNTELSGTTRPFIPDDYAQVLVYGALARCYPIFLNDTERGKFYGELFNDVLALMAAQQKEYAHDQPGIAPDDVYRRQTRRRSRAASSVTLGSWFDRLPNIP